MGDESPVFDKERFDLGVSLVWDAFDEAGLTLVERFRASYIVMAVTSQALGVKFDELAGKLGLKDEPVGASAEVAGAGDGEDAPEEASQQVDGG